MILVIMFHILEIFDILTTSSRAAEDLSKYNTFNLSKMLQL